GWWQAALVLVPAVFVPEFALVHSRRVPRFAARAWVLAAVIGGFAALAVAERGHPGVFAGLAIASLLVGVDARIGRRTPVPGSAGAVVVAGLLVTDASPVVVAALVALATTAVAHAVTRSAPWWAVVVAAAAAAACALVYEAHRSTAIALTAVVLFQLLVATPPRLVAWTVPFLCAAASLAVAWSLVGTA